MARPSGLGRGLSALLPEGGPTATGLTRLPLGAIVANARQPRTRFDEEELEELTESVRQVGVLQPVLVRALADDGQRYELIAGERRLRAAERAGLDAIPALIRQTGDDAMLTEALVENLHRTDLDPLEEASAYEQLLGDFGFSHEQLAQRLGRSRSAISNALRLLQLPAAVQQMLVDREVSSGHARALLGVPDAELQTVLAERVVAEQLSVRQTEALVRTALEARHDGEEVAQRRRSRQSSPYETLQQRLGDALATKVQIAGSRRRGRVVIDYAGTEDLERLLAILSRGTGEQLLEEPPLR